MSEKVTVCIWPYGGLSHFGHVGIKMTSPNIPGGKSYISWWPGDRADTKFNKNMANVRKIAPASVPVPYDARADREREYVHDVLAEMSDRARTGLEAGSFAPRTGQEEIDFGFALGTRLMDEGFPIRKEQVRDSKGYLKGVRYLAWVQKPEKIHLPCIGQPNVKVGINVARMFRWWRVFSAAPTNWYKLMSKNQNCAGVAALALRAGGAASFAKPPKACLFMDPNQVRDWCTKVKNRMDKVNTHANVQHTGFLPARAHSLGLMEIMSLAE